MDKIEILSRLANLMAASDEFSAISLDNDSKSGEIIFRMRDEADGIEAEYLIRIEDAPLDTYDPRRI